MCLNRDSPDLAELRGRIVQVFFKHLTSSNDVAVAMSQDGLTAAIAHHKMPKTLLQARAGRAPRPACPVPTGCLFWVICHSPRCLAGGCVLYRAWLIDECSCLSCLQMYPVAGAPPG